MNIRNVIGIGLAALAGTGAAVVAAGPAQADSAYGCNYPRVCFYRTEGDFNAGRVAAAYQDITSGFQTLGSTARGADAIHNTRNDDVVYLHYTNGRILCLQPNHTMLNPLSSSVVDQIRISSSATC